MGDLNAELEEIKGRLKFWSSPESNRYWWPMEDLRRLIAEVEALQEEIDRLKTKTIDFTGLTSENATLRSRIEELEKEQLQREQPAK